MTDILRIFLITVCMLFCYTIGRKVERELTTKKVLSAVHDSMQAVKDLLKQVKQEMDDAPVPEIGNEFWELQEATEPQKK